MKLAYIADARSPIAQNWINYFIERGVLLRPLGNVVYVLPPYVITREELHYVYDVILQAIETVI